MSKAEAMKKYRNKCACCDKTLKADKNAHFHHLRSYGKEHNLADMFDKYSDKATSIELNKTVLLCAECHIRLHKELGKKVFKKDSLAFIRKERGIA